MITIKIRLLAFVLFSSIGVKAQNLVVTLTNSTTATFPIASIQSIKFAASSMIINEFNGTVTNWNIQDINNYAFDVATGINDLLDINKSSLTIFPNPSFGEVNILFQSEEKSFITIEIIDANGNQIQKIYHGEHQGKETYKWNGKVPNGVYYCRIRTENKTITKPIIIK
jgi:hypothetical protein